MPTIIWDWNGTLLDDVDIAIQAMNTLLRKYNLPRLTLNRYREIFQFPIENYYIYAGFNFDITSFSQLGEQFIQEYYKRLGNASIFLDVKGIVSQFRARGYRQYILSAMEQSALEKTVNDHHLAKYFDGIYGVDDIYGKNKFDRGKQLFEHEHLNPKDTILIGDTIHDFHLATHLGCDILLMAQGHQSEARLRGVSSNVLMNIKEISSYLFRSYPKRSMSRYLEPVQTN